LDSLNLRLRLGLRHFHHNPRNSTVILVIVVIVGKLAQDEENEAGQDSIQPIDGVDVGVTFHANIAHLLATEGEDFGQQLIIVQAVGAAHVPGIPHEILVLGQQLTHPAAKLAGAVPGIPAKQQQIGVLVVIEGIVEGVDVQLAEIVATQIEQAEVLQPKSVLQVVHIGDLVVLQLHVHHMAVVGIVPERVYVSDLVRIDKYKKINVANLTGIYRILNINF